MLPMKPDSPSVDGMTPVASYQEGEVIGYMKKSKMPHDQSIPAMMVVALDADSGHPLVGRSWIPNADEKSARKWLCSKLGPEDAR